MTSSVTGAMKDRAKTIIQPISPEDFQNLRANVHHLRQKTQDIHQKMQELQETAASIQILLQEATNIEDFEPPIVKALNTIEQELSKTSGSLSSSILLLESQTKRIEDAADVMFKKQIVYLRNMVTVVCLLCNLPAPIAVFLLAWRMGIL